MTNVHTYPQRHDDQIDHRPFHGAEVRSMDGKRLGTVGDIQSDLFEVETGRFHRSYWLERALISDSDQQQLIVCVLARDIDDVKLPDAIDQLPPRLSGQEDGLLSDEELDEQRRRMEKEMGID